SAYAGAVRSSSHALPSAVCRGPASTVIHTLSLHDALPIYRRGDPDAADRIARLLRRLRRQGALQTRGAGGPHDGPAGGEVDTEVRAPFELVGEGFQLLEAHQRQRFQLGAEGDLDDLPSVGIALRLGPPGAAGHGTPDRSH